MNKKLLSIIVVFVLILGGAFMLSRDDGSIDHDKTLATVYKSPDCGCCEVYSKYLKNEDYEVVVNNEKDMSIIKDQFNVPHDLLSCHTTIIDGYVIEGHVPLMAVEKLLSEKPDIDGIGLAGMPVGSPGMPGPKTQVFDVKMFSDGVSSGTFIAI